MTTDRDTKAPEPMHPSSKNQANLENMAVTLTLVFSDESHREAWLRHMGVLESEWKAADYDRRRANQNLLYTVGPIGPRREG